MFGFLIFLIHMGFEDNRRDFRAHWAFRVFRSAKCDSETQISVIDSPHLGAIAFPAFERGKKAKVAVGKAGV
jgi:hypothetical protein